MLANTGLQIAGHANVEHTGTAAHDVRGLEVLAHSARNIVGHGGGALLPAIK